LDEDEERDEYVTGEKKQKEVKEDTRKKDLVVDVTAENIGDFTMQHVVLPIVGPCVRLPTHPEMAQIMLDILKEDNITLQMFADQDGVLATSASGDYRRILTKPADV